AERAQPREREPVHDGAHRVLAHAEVQVAARGFARRDAVGAGEREPGLGRGREVARAAHEPRHAFADGVEHLARGGARGELLAVGGKVRKLRVDRKSTRLNSSHVAISYAVFCLKKKNTSISRS